MGWIIYLTRLPIKAGLHRASCTSPLGEGIGAKCVIFFCCLKINVSFRVKATPKFFQVPEEGDDTKVESKRAILTCATQPATRHKTDEGIRWENERKMKKKQTFFCRCVHCQTGLTMRMESESSDALFQIIPGNNQGHVYLKDLREANFSARQGIRKLEAQLSQTWRQWPLCSRRRHIFAFFCFDKMTIR